MAKLISKDSSWAIHQERKDPEEFHSRIRILKECINDYYIFNHNNSNIISRDVSRIDINSTCGKQINAIKQFALETGLRYESVYSEIPEVLQKKIY